MTAPLTDGTKKESYRIFYMMKRRLQPFVLAQVLPASGIEEVKSNRGMAVSEHRELVDDPQGKLHAYTYSGGLDVERGMDGQPIIKGNERTLDQASLEKANRLKTMKVNAGSYFTGEGTELLISLIRNGWTQSEIEKAMGELGRIGWGRARKEVIIPAHQVPHVCVFDNKEIPIGVSLVRLVTHKGTSTRSGRNIAFSNDFHGYDCLSSYFKDLLKTFKKSDWKDYRTKEEKIL